MEQWLAYWILALMAIAVLFFLYRTYQAYRANPGRWALRELATEWFSR